MIKNIEITSDYRPFVTGLRIHSLDMSGVCYWDKHYEYGLFSGASIDGQSFANSTICLTKEKILWSHRNDFSDLIFYSNLMCFVMEGGICIADETGIKLQLGSFTPDPIKTFSCDGKELIFCTFWQDYHFSLDGQLKNVVRRYDDLLKTYEPYWVRWTKVNVADELIESASENAIFIAKKLLISAAEGFDDTPRHKANCYKKLGEIALKNHDVELTKKYWSDAIEVFPKIGLKVKLKKLSA